jgi:hypothetical protein
MKILFTSIFKTINLIVFLVYYYTLCSFEKDYLTLYIIFENIEYMSKES